MVSGFRFPKAAERGHEGQHRQSVYPPDPANGGVGYFACNPNAHLTESSSLATPSNAGRLFGEWSQHWDLTKPYLLEKSPPNLLMTRFLQELFPQAYFVVIVRHPIAVSLASLKWMGWPTYFLSRDPGHSGNGTYQIRRAVKADNPLFTNDRQLFMESILFTLFDHWRTAHEIFLKDRAFLEKVIVVRYEDLVSDTDSTLAKLADFLELGGEKLRSEEVADHNVQYLTQWTSFASDVVSSEFKSLASSRFGEYFSKFGYSVLGQLVEKSALPFEPL